MQKNILSLVGGVGIVVAVIAIIVGVNYARQTENLEQQLEELKRNPQQAVQNEIQTLIDSVGKLIALPEGEQPTVATITDREKLKDVPFFTKAENGDKVLIYVNARKAFLYRPSTDKLIEVATINLTPGAQTQALEGKIVLRNGTETSGLTKQVEDQLKGAAPKLGVVSRDNAKEPTFEKTVVVDLTGKRGADAQRLAVLLNATVADLPEGEAKPSGADFLVILGKDRVANRGATSSPTTPPSGSPSPSPSPTKEP